MHTWLSDIAGEDESLAAAILREIDQNTWVTNDKMQVAEFFDVAPETIDLWQRKGMPYTSGGRGVRGRYDLREASRWLAAQKTIQPEANEEQARVEREYREEKRKIAELQRRKLEGSLVDAEDYQQRMLRTITMIRRGVEAFHKTFGNEAVQMLADIVDEAEQNMRQELDVE